MKQQDSEVVDYYAAKFGRLDTSVLLPTTLYDQVLERTQRLLVKLKCRYSFVDKPGHVLLEPYGAKQDVMATVKATINDFVSLFVYASIGSLDTRVEVRRTYPYCSFVFALEDVTGIHKAMLLLHKTRDAHQRMVQDYLHTKHAVRTLPEDVSDKWEIRDGHLHVWLQSKSRGTLCRVL